LSRFTSDGSQWRTLAEFELPKQVYPIGRLDADSEGLLLLSDDKRLVDAVLHPKHHRPKTYWVQIERIPEDAALAALAKGVQLKEGLTRPAEVRRIEAPPLPPRDPPIRFRKTVPDCWIELRISEGKNRQVRRMTAAVGHPTLRLVRAAIADVELDGLEPGQKRLLTREEEARLLR
jgi:23S rRNA pseudouridine2457 synthase